MRQVDTQYHTASGMHLDHNCQKHLHACLSNRLLVYTQCYNWSQLVVLISCAVLTSPASSKSSARRSKPGPASIDELLATPVNAGEFNLLGDCIASFSLLRPEPPSLSSSSSLASAPNTPPALRHRQCPLNCHAVRGERSHGQGSHGHGHFWNHSLGSGDKEAS